MAWIVHLNYMKFEKRPKKTNMLRYGYEYSSQSPDIKEKVKQTSLRKYGTEYPCMSDIVRQKIMESFYLNGTQATSSQQLSIYNMMRNYYGEDCVKLNYPCGRCFLDVVVMFENISINIEYDGAFWHTDLNKDRKRDEFVKTKGYRILRIKSRRKIPELTDLVNTIELLKNGEHTYSEIVLPDWETTQNDYNINQIDINDENLDINNFNGGNANGRIEN